MEDKRNSNFELMRILSMFLIVFFHVIVHGKVIENASASRGIQEIFTFLKIFTIVHVNSFILLSGYYQSTSTFKQKQIWNLIAKVVFYELSIMALMMFCKVIPFDKNTLIIELFPIELVLNSYWFIKYYILLYCLSPFINNAINSFTKKTFQHLLIVLTIMSSLLPFLSGLNSMNNNGFTLYHFIYLYLIGAYIRKYPLKDSYIGKAFSNNLWQLSLIIIMILSALSNYLLLKAGISLHGINNTLDIISDNIQRTSIMYSNPFVIIQSISYFCLFETFKIKNKFINKIASLTIGIYLIHDNHFIRENIYRWLKIDNGMIYSYKFIIYVIGISIIIFMVSTFIEFIRKIIIQFICRTKISTSIRNKYYIWSKSLYILDEEKRKS